MNEDRTMALPPTGKAVDTKALAFTGIMSALGIILSFISTQTLPIGPGVSVDLSHVGTYIVAVGGGPIFGMATGAIVGVIPSFQYANPLVIPGKLMTGATVGFISMFLKRLSAKRNSRKIQVLRIPLAGMLGYVPEFIFTIGVLKFITMLPDPVIIQILIKAWIEISIITAMMVFLYGSQLIDSWIDMLVGKNSRVGAVEYLIMGSVVGVTTMVMMGIAFFTGFGFLSGDALVIAFYWWFIGIAIALAVLVALLIFFFSRRHLRAKDELPSKKNGE